MGSGKSEFLSRLQPERAAVGSGHLHPLAHIVVKIVVKLVAAVAPARAEYIHIEACGIRRCHDGVHAPLVGSSFRLKEIEVAVGERYGFSYPFRARRRI